MKKPTNDVTIRFLEAYEYLKKQKKVLTPTSFARHLGVSTSLITEICKERTNAGIVPIQKLVEEFPEINATWILTNKGEMVLSNENVKKEVKTFKLRTDNDLQHQSIPIYNLEATAGLVELFRGSEEMEVLDTMSIPNLPRCDGAVYVAGDSMYPLLKNGDIVAYRKVEDIQNDIFWGEMYLLSIDVGEEEFVTVKYIQKSEKGIEYIKLVSENKHHQDKDVQLKKIRALALIKATIRLNTMN